MLETARLTLRSPCPEDAHALCAIRNSAFVMRYNPMKPMDEDALRAELAVQVENRQVFHLEEKATGRMIGVIDLEPDTLRHGVASMAVAYYLDEQCAGKGYMSEALPAVINYAFEQLALELVAARVFAGNEASSRLLLHCGMLREAHLRYCVRGSDGVVYDDELYSITRDEWTQARGGYPPQSVFTRFA